LVNASGLPTVATRHSVGSGFDRGVALGVAIEAELTSHFAAPKIGTIVYPGARTLVSSPSSTSVIPDDVDRGGAPMTEAILAPDARRARAAARSGIAKRTNGHVVVIAGGAGSRRRRPREPGRARAGAGS